MIQDIEITEAFKTRWIVVPIQIILKPISLSHFSYVFHLTVQSFWFYSSALSYVLEYSCITLLFKAIIRTIPFRGCICFLSPKKDTSLQICLWIIIFKKTHITCFFSGYLLGFQFLRSNFSQWKVKNTEQKWNFMYISSSIKFIKEITLGRNSESCWQGCW